MKIIRFSEFVNLLGHAANLDAKTVKASNAGLELTLNVDGKSITALLQPNGVSFNSKDYELLMQLTPVEKGVTIRPKNMEDPTLEDLDKHNLPYYWNREWLGERIKELGSYAEVARTYPREVRGSSPTTIANYARKKFGWTPRREVNLKRHKVVNEYDKVDGKITQPELARKFNVAVSTINRWLSDARQSYKELIANRRRYISDEAREWFAEQHNLTTEIVFRWLDVGSTAFAEDRNTQPKQRYFSRSEYEKLRAEVQEYYLLKGGDINASELARRYNVDRSTIHAWTRDVKAIHG